MGYCLRRIKRLIKGQRETIESFFHDILKLRPKLRNPVDERDLMKIIKKNLRDNLSKLIYPMTIYSLDHLRDECIEAEIHFYQQHRNHGINEVCLSQAQSNYTWS